MTKLDHAGAALIYSTYMGGADEDAAQGIAVATGSLAYICGYTYSTNFPVTAGAFQTSFKGMGDVFVARFSIADPPVVTTGQAAGVSFGGATLNGVLTSAGTTPGATVSFQYGGSPGTYNSETPGRASGAGPFAATIDLLGNWQGITVYYRARAVGADGLTNYGTEMSFTVSLPQTPSHGTGSSLTPTPFVPISNILVQSSSISANRVAPGTTVTVSSTMVNKSTVNGTSTVKLYVNGQLDSSRGVSVNSGNTVPVIFEISRSEPGTYNVYVNSTPAGSFTVEDYAGPNIILFASCILIFGTLIIGSIYIWRRKQYR
jgi:hypothetical protein